MKNLKYILPLLLILYFYNKSLSEYQFDASGLRPLAENEIAEAINYINALAVLLPLDESAFRSDFSDFKHKVIKAAIDCDSDFILSIIDTDILNSFGGNGGIDEFKTMWKIGDDHSPFWRLFKRALELGGTFSADTLSFEFPYLATTFPEKYDSFFYGALIREGADIYLSPDKDSEFHTAAYTIFRILQWPDIKLAPQEDFIPVLVNENRYGFVHEADFRSPLDYRGMFIYKNNTWKLASFIAGD